MIERLVQPQSLPFEMSLDRPYFPEMQFIPRERLTEALQLTEMPPHVRESVQRSHWASISDGKMLIETRNLSPFFPGDRQRTLHFYDFDDCMMSTTRWHGAELNQISQSQSLHAAGVDISVEEAMAVYDLSKIRVPGKAENEKRYTPVLNMILLTRLIEARKASQSTDGSASQSWFELQKWFDTILHHVGDQGERVFDAFTIDPEIKRIFMDNEPQGFVYTGFTDEVLGRTHEHDLRVIATRGKIEGPLGQIHKVHASGLMNGGTPGTSIDAVIYSNDIKAEALLTFLRLLRCSSDGLIQIYDDNPAEILPFLGVIKSLGATNIEVIQVSHPDAKRKDVKVEAEPTLRYTIGDTTLRHFSLSSMQGYQPNRATQ